MLRDLLVILKDAGQRQDVRAILLSAVGAGWVDWAP